MTSFESYSTAGLNRYQPLPIKSSRDPINHIDLADPRGGSYQIGQRWFNTENANYWRFIGNGEWVLDSSSPGPLLHVDVPIGTSPIDPDATGTLNFTSNLGTIAITGTAGGLGAQSINFDLAGGGIAFDQIAVQAVTAPGVTPVVPTGAGLLTVNGSAVAAHSVPIETRSRAANTYNVEVQYSAANATTDATKSGIAHFNSTQFSVDGNGFVQLAGGGLAIDSIGTQTGTNPIVPTVAGLVTINGAVVAAGTNPLRSNGTGANTMALEAQISQAIASTDATKIGLSNFDSALFSVDANGFVSLNVGSSVCSFLAYLNANVTNWTGDGTGGGVIPLNAVEYNIGSAFNTGTGKFTAPKTGRYLINATISISNIGAAHTTGRYWIVIRNAGGTIINLIEYAQQSPAATQNVDHNFTISGSHIVSMTATDTADIETAVNGSTKTITLNGSASITSTPYCLMSGSMIV